MSTTHTTTKAKRSISKENPNSVNLHLRCSPTTKAWIFAYRDEHHYANLGEALDHIRGAADVGHVGNFYEGEDRRGQRHAGVIATGRVVEKLMQWNDSLPPPAIPGRIPAEVIFISQRTVKQVIGGRDKTHAAYWREHGEKIAAHNRKHGFLNEREGAAHNQRNRHRLREMQEYERFMQEAGKA